VTFALGIMLVIANLIVDIIYGFLDPCIRIATSAHSQLAQVSMV